MRVEHTPYQFYCLLLNIFRFYYSNHSLVTGENVLPDVPESIVHQFLVV